MGNTSCASNPPTAVMRLVDRIRHVRQSGGIERCHQWPKTQPYRNGQHTWGACVILRLLWPEDRHLLDFALFHDVPELNTGDIPSPSISRLGIEKHLEHEDRRVMTSLGLPCEHALSPEDWHKLRAADSLDLWLWCWDEDAMGNQAVRVMREAMDRSFGRRQEAGTLPPEAWAFINEFREEGWKRMGEI